MKKLTPANYRSMPWKNGAGTTIEIAVDADAPGLDNFTWRVSRAAVMTDGAFSYFEGIDRTLALLSGAGMQLNVGGEPMRVDLNRNFISFSGDQVTEAVLIDGPIHDFNLMTRRSRCTHTLHHWQGPNNFSLPADTVLVYCAKGHGAVTQNGSEFVLDENETALTEPNDDLAAVSLRAESGARFYCVEVHRQGHHDDV